MIFDSPFFAHIHQIRNPLHAHLRVPDSVIESQCISNLDLDPHGIVQERMKHLTIHSSKKKKKKTFKQPSLRNCILFLSLTKKTVTLVLSCMTQLVTCRINTKSLSILLHTCGSHGRFNRIIPKNNRKMPSFKDIIWPITLQSYPIYRTDAVEHVHTA